MLCNPPEASRFERAQRTNIRRVQTMKERMKGFKVKEWLLVMGLLLLLGTTSVGYVEAVDLTAQEKYWLTYMREEEKVARDVYLFLYEKWGLRIFENISGSEQ